MGALQRSPWCKPWNGLMKPVPATCLALAAERMVHRTWYIPLDFFKMLLGKIQDLLEMCQVTKIGQHLASRMKVH
jgi:hypothetical protein